MRGRLPRLLKNEQGDVTVFSVFLILVLVMVMAFLLLYTSVQIQTMNIRNGVKMELNNLSAKIYADTFHSQREANLVSYERRVTSSSAYLASLKNSFRNGLGRKLPLETEDYRLSGIELNFVDEGEEIRYTFQCHAEFFIHMFGGTLPPIEKDIVLTGSHRAKY